MAFRIVFLLVLLGALFIFVQSNGLPVQLTFLGIQTPAVPLGIWILAAIGAGILTSLILNGLFHLTNRSAERQARTRFRRTGEGSFQSEPSAPFDPFRSYKTSNRSSRSSDTDDDADWKNWEGYEDRNDRPQSRQETPPADAPPKTQPSDPIDDWESSDGDDWEEFEDTPRQDAANPTAQKPTQTPTNYETRREPTTTSQSGSVYSYGYRDPRNSGAGRVEPVTQARNPDEPDGNRSRSVVDAEYRVIVPPYQPIEPEPIEPEPGNNADDWFDEDDDLETDEERHRRTGF